MGLRWVNSPGTIDADYRGEVQAPLINHGKDPFVVERGMRIAQMLVVPVPAVELIEVEELDSNRPRVGWVWTYGKMIGCYMSVVSCQWSVVSVFATDY